MNYIKQLEARVEELNLQRAVAWEKVAELKQYLGSSKFHNDTTVQVADVLRRLADVDLSASGLFDIKHRGPKV